MLKDKLSQSGGSIFTFFTSLPNWSRKEFMWGLLITPIILTMLMHYISDNNIFGWQNSKYCKEQLEILHPSLLACAVLLAFTGWIWTKDLAPALLGILAAGALGREILGQGHTFIFVIAILIVIVFTEQNRTKMATFLKSKVSTSLLGMTFACYIISQLLDRGVIKRIGWLITWDTSWKPMYSSNIEESLEALGGLFLVFTVISVIRSARRKKYLD